MPNHDQIIQILAQIRADLAEHMRRTAAAEERLTLMEKFVTETLAYMRGLKWLAAALVGIVGLAKTLGVF